MPYMLLIKILLPVLMAAGLTFVSYSQGQKATQKLWDARELTLTTASTEALYLGKQRELTALTELTVAQNKLTQTKEKDDEIISNLTQSNRKLLANRLRTSKTSSSSSGTMSKDTHHAEGTPTTRDSAYWELPVEAGEAIITDYALADRINASRNSCMAWVKALENVNEMAN